MNVRVILSPTLSPFQNQAGASFDGVVTVLAGCINRAESPLGMILNPLRLPILPLRKQAEQWRGFTIEV